MKDNRKESSLVLQKMKKVIKVIGMITVGFAIVLAVGFLVFYESGKSQLKEQAATASFSNLGAERTLTKPPEVIDYNGHQYHYNSDLYVILCMGIDTENDMVEEGTPTGNSGQSDANFLVVLDERQKRISIIAIPRDTMTGIDIYDVVGGYVDTIEEHLALQYAYGNGGSESCAMMERAVSRLMYGMPINAYVSFSLNAIEILNGMVGGVPVTLEENFEEYKAGETVTLNNEQAYRYVRLRDCEEDYSADARLKRQKQYLTAYVEKAIACTKEDVRQPFRIYHSVSDYMITDVTSKELFSMVVLGLNCEFSESYFYRVPGEQQLGDGYEEFHVDQEALYELILEVFYLPEE